MDSSTWYAKKKSDCVMLLISIALWALTWSAPQVQALSGTANTTQPSASFRATDGGKHLSTFVWYVTTVLSFL